MANVPIYKQVDSVRRLRCYLLISAFTTISSEIQHSNWASYTWQQAVVSICAVVVAMCTAWRAYVDQTDGQVSKEDKP